MTHRKNIVRLLKQGVMNERCKMCCFQYWPPGTRYLAAKYDMRPRSLLIAKRVAKRMNDVINEGFS